MAFLSFWEKPSFLHVCQCSFLCLKSSCSCRQGHILSCLKPICFLGCAGNQSMSSSASDKFMLLRQMSKTAFSVFHVLTIQSSCMIILIKPVKFLYDGLNQSAFFKPNLFFPVWTQPMLWKCLKPVLKCLELWNDTGCYFCTANIGTSSWCLTKNISNLACAVNIFLTANLKMQFCLRALLVYALALSSNDCTEWIHKRTPCLVHKSHIHVELWQYDCYG